MKNQYSVKDKLILLLLASQNLSGLLGAILLIEGVVDRNLAVAITHNSLTTTKSLTASSEN
ncbi:MAG TPA: hypothetical protein VNW49_04280 [Puia sp.]|jgi:hypothetical protein|nr:hypothetical protein [Puia sp.]